MQTTVEPIRGTNDPVQSLELSLVVPIFNEEQSVGPLVERVAAAMVSYPHRWELILVDDGSTDATLVNARKYVGREGLALRIVELQRNFGQTAAMQAGIDTARGRLIATMDGDLQNDPKDIPSMVSELERRELDLLVGWRKNRKDGLFLRKIPSWCANYLIGRITGVKLHDYGCSLKIYRASIIKQVKLMGEMHRFIPAWVAGVVPSSRIGEMAVTHHAREHGVSKYGISRTFRVILDLLSVMFFMRYKARPGHFFGSLGLGLGALAMLILLYLGFDKFILGNDIGTRPMLMVGVVLLLSSVQMITTGILAEMIARTYYRDDASPNYIVRQIFDDQSQA
ncbi:glycosyltransferase family 2 protein [Rhizobium johnstonii]|uniref:Dodecaprenyl-phosphate galacturonate synthase n=5 Tax=Rhizobium TaxID=379 RepID=RGTE_RHIJ3|nr:MULTISPECIES: glycosyltransferase family 2 protein [Rhizobium]Q1MJ95.1 RecName: Full=Dodecaprenyl-phosphate galacturonate synthase; Short=Dod-P-GalA synthase; AltName: Full=Dodecaprenyl-phosphate galacturonosyltransferase RgtE; AltName: Full=Galacturonic acid transferase RgtE; Short=GalA transferase RgtE; Short=GalAT RgtE [Rhizobium johnstonii 3841]EJC70273.1 glycosyl transferase [Rhizobium leguminosarum bv. viciae WSM1455]ACS55401.1 glycosyl transferase family 2 [Rhizobium leguminosarum bv. 